MEIIKRFITAIAVLGIIALALFLVWALGFLILFVASEAFNLDVTNTFQTEFGTGVLVTVLTARKRIQVVKS